jgi:hypothetical protein
MPATSALSLGDGGWQQAAESPSRRNIDNRRVNSLEQLLEFLIRLQNARITFRLECVRDAIMVVIPTPSKYYEVEFFADGHIERQTFGPSGSVEQTTLDEITEVVLRDVNG